MGQNSIIINYFARWVMKVMPRRADFRHFGVLEERTDRSQSDVKMISRGSSVRLTPGRTPAILRRNRLCRAAALVRRPLFPLLMPCPGWFDWGALPGVSRAGMGSFTEAYFPVLCSLAAGFVRTRPIR